MKIIGCRCFVLFGDLWYPTPRLQSGSVPAASSPKSPMSTWLSRPGKDLWGAPRALTLVIV